MKAVPAGLEHWRTRPGGGEWLESLPRLVAECAEQWGLRLEAPLEPATVSLVVPVGDAVLKINFPDAESEHEAAALEHWGGDGAVRLLAYDETRRALLVERCRPGRPLWTVEEDAANRAAAAVLRRLWRRPAPAAPFRTLAGEAERWARELPARWERHGRPCPRALLDRAVVFLSEAAPATEVVVHQDCHGGNLLAAGRAPWLAIDPKPLAGEPAFDLASLLRDRRAELADDPQPARRLRRRLDLLSAETGVERGRAREWGIAHALAWGLEEDRVHPDIVACADWLSR